MSQYRAYAFLTSQSLSILGSALSGIAIPWLLLEQDPSATTASMVLSFQALAAVVTMLLGSLLIDKYDKRSFCMVSDLTLCIALAAIIALYWMKLLTPVAIVLFVVLHAVMRSLSHAAETALIPSIATTSKFSNHRLNGLIGVFHNTGDLLGPAIGGFIITSIGLAGALMLDRAWFLISFLLFLFFIPANKSSTTPSDAQASAPANGKQIREELFGGMREVLFDPLLRCLSFASAVINMVLTPLLSVVILVLVKNRSGSALDAGLLLSGFGVGGFIASALFAWAGARLSALPAMAASLFLMLLAFCALPIVPEYAVLPCLFVIGLCVGYLGPLEHTMVQNHTQEHLLGRVLLAYSAGRTLFVPIGFFMSAALLPRYGVQAVCWAMAALLLLPTLNVAWFLLGKRQA